MAGERISSDALAAFAVFATELNLTRAAKLLHISQPSLHSKLGTLSRELGCVLYERRGRRLVLTPDGEATARYAREHSDRLDRFLGELHTTPIHQPIVLAAGHAAYLHVLGDMIRSTLAQKPGALRLLHTSRNQMLDAVRTGRAHLGVSVLDDLPHDLITVPVATYPQVLLAPDGHRLAARASVELADLADEEFVVPPPNRPHRVSFERAMRAADIPWKVGIEIEGWPLTVHFAALGVGLAVVVGCIKPAPGAVAVPIADLPPVTYHAAYRREGEEDPRVAELLAAICER
ncbi:LysR family transcriptional regulator [Actinoplanes auranticolor]|uniref:LysR family transcriptional regulator n=1 Tax=Actinoplanes auranticolor TaxID=47988 RepID=A0A919SV69_9ACTN|nr:LysR family transcriptional regulator [Actinoplanes auranticolor]GIM77628.1 LysR family transcriptional regulator [Actinoplanes auranticolor]